MAYLKCADCNEKLFNDDNYTFCCDCYKELCENCCSPKIISYFSFEKDKNNERCKKCYEKDFYKNFGKRKKKKNKKIINLNNTINQFYF